ncbi:MAG TPA: cyclic nucleotide-binding domain-containing protein [Pseudolabrys sp.]|nr:cyclic nucleotide-binding domain-containing protein [Pseudolabrys sp.]
MRKVLYILSRLNDEDVDWMATTGKRTRHAAGDVLIQQGGTISSLMFVLDGKVSVEVEGVGQVASLGSGEMLGEMSLVDESPPSATVVVVEPTQVLHIDRAALNVKLAQEPAFAARLYRAIAMFLSVRMRSTVQRLGYGKATVENEDEIDMSLLETVTIAGSRFDRMLKRLLTA